MHVYLKLKICWSGLERLRRETRDVDFGLLRRQGVSGDSHGMEEESSEEKLKVLYKYVAEAYGRDFYDFIQDCVAAFQEENLNVWHRKLAMAMEAETRYEMHKDRYLGEEEFTNENAWTFLYNMYFDEIENDFYLFYKCAPYCTFKCFVAGFLNSDVSALVKYIPVYRVAYADETMERASHDPLDVVDMNALREVYLKMSSS